MSGNSAHMITPRKLMYFKEEEMMLEPFKSTSICYVRIAIAEYHWVVEDLNKRLSIDPTYHPIVNLKRMLDENELKPITVDEW